MEKKKNLTNKVELESLTDDCPMPFGVHKDKPMIKVPPEYLMSLKKKYDERVVKVYSKIELQVYEYLVEMESALLLEIKLRKKSKDKDFVFQPDVNYINDREEY